MTIKRTSPHRSSLNALAAITLAAISIAMPSTSNAQVGFRTDIDDNGTVNISDVSYLINIILGRTTDAAVEAGLCPNTMHPHIIALGLPSGTKWTCCNVGAANPLEFGDYYAWGESLTKETYSEDTYCYYDSKNSSYVSIGNDIAGTNYDVTTLKWGTKYSMPSNDQCKELIDNCTYTWTTIGGVNGGLFTATNGKKIFIPAAGYRLDNDLENEGSFGYCWSSTQRPDDAKYAYYFFFGSSAVRYQRYSNRYNGSSVRPVTKQ